MRLRGKKGATRGSRSTVAVRPYRGNTALQGYKAHMVLTRATGPLQAPYGLYSDKIFSVYTAQFAQIVMQ